VAEAEGAVRGPEHRGRVNSVKNSPIACNKPVARVTEEQLPVTNTGGE
jgi:hypothetical protein